MLLPAKEEQIEPNYMQEQIQVHVHYACIFSYPRLKLVCMYVGTFSVIIDYCELLEAQV